MILQIRTESGYSERLVSDTERALQVQQDEWRRFYSTACDRLESDYSRALAYERGELEYLGDRAHENLSFAIEQLEGLITLPPTTLKGWRDELQSLQNVLIEARWSNSDRAEDHKNRRPNIDSRSEILPTVDVRGW